MKIKNCEKCGKEFRTSPSNEKVRRFCSFECRKAIYTPEMRKRMSEIKKKQFSNGAKPWNKNKQMSQEYRDIVSKSLKGLKGENSRNWKGGHNPMWIRKQRLAINGGSHTLAEWEELQTQYNFTCPRCGLIKVLTKDHIIPISKGGSDNIENIQPLCRSCNSQKHKQEIKFEF